MPGLKNDERPKILASRIRRPSPPAPKAATRRKGETAAGGKLFLVSGIPTVVGFCRTVVPKKLTAVHLVAQTSLPPKNSPIVTPAKGAKRAQPKNILATTLDVIKAGLKSDPTVSPRDRTKILANLRSGPGTATTNLTDPPEASRQRIQRIVRRAEAARLYGCSLRLMDRLAAQGVLKKVRLPGRKRGAGFLETDLLAVMAGKETA